MRTTHHKTCNLCEATCGLLIDVEDKQVVDIRGDENDPFSRGHICPKAFALRDIHHDPDRIKRPMKRFGSDWREISWDEALEETADRIVGIQKKYGTSSFATYIGNPTAHNFASAMYGIGLVQSLGTKSRFSASSADQNPHHASSLWQFGSPVAFPVPDIDRTKYMIIIGANPLASNGSIMTAPDVRNRLKAIQQRGGKIVVIDPRKSETARMADEHVFIRPGFDALFLTSVLNAIFDEGLAKPGALKGKLQGMDGLEAWLRPMSPELAEKRLGIPAQTIRRIAREFAIAESAVCYGRIGSCVQEFGTLTSLLINSLNMVTGNFDRPGGAMFTTPAVDMVDLWKRAGLKSGFRRWKSRVRGLPEFNGELSVSCMAEEILTPGEGQIRGMMTFAGNPILSTPNGRKLDEAFRSLEFYAAFDIYINETSRHAHIILPPAWSLEQDNYEAVFHLVAVRNTAKFSPAIFEPEPGMKRDYEILTDLMLRVQEKKAKGAVQRFALRTARKRGLVPSPRRLLDTLLRIGPHGDKFIPGRKGLNLKKLEKIPQGVDLGALEPSLERIIQTKNGRVPLNLPIVREELTRLSHFRDHPEEFEKEDSLLLIGRRDLRTNNSWGHNSKTLITGKKRCNLLMNPEDAQRLGLSSDEQVRIKSRVGEVVTGLTISDEVMPGVVSLPHGWGHDREGVQLSVARENPGVSVNDLTDDQVVEPVIAQAVLNGVPVTVASA